MAFAAQLQPLQYPQAGSCAALAAQPAAAPANPPHAFHLLGRQPQLENADVCGEYAYQGNHDGFSGYMHRENGNAIRFSQRSGRWLIDRAGFRDSDVCVGFAYQIQGCSHPAHPELIWHIWNSSAQKHVEDDQVFAIDAPVLLTFVGHQEHENSMVNGKYKLSGLILGKPYYQHVTESLIIRFCEDGRWKISEASHVDSNLCSAWADAGNAQFPDENLQWHFFTQQRQAFTADPNSGLVDAPNVVRVTGRNALNENACINGTYHLAGVQHGRPLYVLPGTAGVIRYSPKSDRWLIDSTGLAAPSLFNRFYQWVMTGDAEAAYDKCNAWSSAQGTKHPGHLNVKWHVWDISCGKHILDKHVMVTSAPLAVQVSRLEVGGENCDVAGIYKFAGEFQELPLYQKPGTHTCMYYSSSRRWVIDRNGPRDTGVCVAYVDGESEDPTTTRKTWQLFDGRRGTFTPDIAMSVAAIEVPCEVPVSFPMGDQGQALADSLPIAHPACHGLKRGYGMEPNFGHPVHAPRAKLARTTDPGGTSWFGIFGA